ncbi:hypothetical protein [uncultured Cohaesibacter sp.]|uniref:hypothetical protein n=1 Tax=uncultured Cohaesibacter sp. TaxID=1002546 RepID=UPI0029C7D6B7|nr:hypothetical protein [uncultured Cohaesibacter sp.]
MFRVRTKDLWTAIGFAVLVTISGCLSLETGTGDALDTSVTGSEIEPLVPLEPLDFSSPGATKPASEAPVVIPASPDKAPMPVLVPSTIEVKGDVLWGFPAGPGDIILVELRDGSRLLGQQKLLTAPAGNKVPFNFTPDTVGAEKCLSSNSCRVIARMKRGELIRASGQTRFQSGGGMTIQIGMLGDVS